jgi:hypothetical protein
VRGAKSGRNSRAYEGQAYLSKKSNQNSTISTSFYLLVAFNKINEEKPLPKLFCIFVGHGDRSMLHAEFRYPLGDG